MVEKLYIPTKNPNIVVAPITEQEDVAGFLELRPRYPHSRRHTETPDYWRFRDSRQKRAREDRLNPDILRTAIRVHGHFVGVAALYPYAAEPKTREVAYEVLENYRTNDYGLFAIAALTIHAARNLGVEVVTFEVPNNDDKRIQIADELGFRYTEEKSESAIYVRKVTPPKSTPNVPVSQLVAAEETIQPAVLLQN